MSESLTVRGVVATEVRLIQTDSALPIASFRLASTERKFDRKENAWVDGDTNWFSVSAFRNLAQNVALSVRKGERVIVTGRLKVRQWVREDGSHGTSAELEAESVGHDLMWGTARYSRSNVQRGSGADTAGDGGSADAPGGGSADGETEVHPETGEIYAQDGEAAGDPQPRREEADGNDFDDLTDKLTA